MVAATSSFSRATLIAALAPAEKPKKQIFSKSLLLKENQLELLYLRLLYIQKQKNSRRFRQDPLSQKNKEKILVDVILLSGKNHLFPRENPFCCRPIPERIMIVVFSFPGTNHAESFASSTKNLVFHMIVPNIEDSDSFLFAVQPKDNLLVVKQ